MGKGEKHEVSTETMGQSDSADNLKPQRGKVLGRRNSLGCVL